MESRIVFIAHKVNTISLVARTGASIISTTNGAPVVVTLEPGSRKKLSCVSLNIGSIGVPIRLESIQQTIVATARLVQSYTGSVCALKYKLCETRKFMKDKTISIRSYAQQQERRTYKDRWQRCNVFHSAPW